MKNYSLIFIMLLTCISCAKDYDNISITSEKTRFPAEEYKPNATGEPITLQSGITVNKIDSATYILEGDMILNKEQLELLDKPITRGAIIKDFAKYWPNGNVYYSVDKDFGSTTALLRAMDMITNAAEITFIPRTNQPNYILFVPSPENDRTNASPIGMQRRRTESNYL